MIYSRWRPDGGYDYFADNSRHGLADDMPVPRLPGGTAIGVPSTSIGRPLPPNAAPQGSGELPQGQIVPMEKLGGLGSMMNISSSDVVGLVVIGMFFGWWLHGALKKDFQKSL